MTWVGKSAATAMVALASLAMLVPSDASFGADPARAPERAQRHAVPPPGSDAWRPLMFRRIDRHTVYSRESRDGVEFLRADSDCAASGLVLSVSDVDVSRTPRLSWRWRVDEPLDIHDERSKEGDDFAARVYVMFRFDSSRASVFDRLRHRIGNALYEDRTPGKTLNFIWTSREQPGVVWDNPFAKDAKMIALAQGTSTNWRTETVDVVEHYGRHFGTPVPKLMGLAVMTDSDNSCQNARARFADFSFSSRAPDRAQEPVDQEPVDQEPFDDD